MTKEHFEQLYSASEITYSGDRNTPVACVSISEVVGEIVARLSCAASNWLADLCVTS